jgi:hypothetical protein
MGQDRAEQAVGRIERALARIDSAAHRIATAPTAALTTDDSGLQEKHEALRRSVGEAIARLDTLLIPAERG